MKVSPPSVGTRGATAHLKVASLALTCVFTCAASSSANQLTSEVVETHRHEAIERSQVKTWTTHINGREWEVHPATSTYEGTTGLFHMPSAYTLPKGKLSLSFFRDNLDRSPKDEDVSIHGVSLGFGLSDRFELYGNFGLQNRIDADALFQPGRVNDYPFVATAWETGRGDLKVGAKYRFLDDYRGDPIALAARVFVKFPTADKDRGLGTGAISLGGDLILSKNVGDVMDLHGSLGFQLNGDPDTPVPVDLANVFSWSVGLNMPVRRWIQLQAELTSSKYIGGSNSPIPGAAGVTGPGNQDFFNRVVPGGDPRTMPFGIGPQDNPLDLVIGPVLWIKPGIFIRPAISWNLNFDDHGLNSSSKSWTGRQISVGYHPGWGCREIAVPPPPPPPPPADRAPTVSCEIERSTILPGESVRVRATASDPDGDPLTYEWSATAGRVSGTGPTATFDSTGMTPPASSTITIRISDGRNGTASSACIVQLRPAAESLPPTSSDNLAEFSVTDHVLMQIDTEKAKCGPPQFLSALSGAASKSGCSSSRVPDTQPILYNDEYSLVVDCSVEDKPAAKLRVEVILLARWRQSGGAWELSYHADAFEVSVRSATDSAGKRYASKEARAGVLKRAGCFGKFFAQLDQLLKECAP